MRMAANSESELRRRRGAGKEKPPVVEREKKKIPASDLKVLTQSSVIKICLFVNCTMYYDYDYDAMANITRMNLIWAIPCLFC